MPGIIDLIGLGAGLLLAARLCGQNAWSSCAASQLAGNVLLLAYGPWQQVSFWVSGVKSYVLAAM